MSSNHHKTTHSWVGPLIMGFGECHHLLLTWRIKSQTDIVVTQKNRKSGEWRSLRWKDWFYLSRRISPTTGTHFSVGVTELTGLCTTLGGIGSNNLIGTVHVEGIHNRFGWFYLRLVDWMKLLLATHFIFHSEQHSRWFDWDTRYDEIRVGTFAIWKEGDFQSPVSWWDFGLNFVIRELASKFKNCYTDDHVQLGKRIGDAGSQLIGDGLKSLTSMQSLDLNSECCT